MENFIPVFKAMFTSIKQIFCRHSYENGDIEIYVYADDPAYIRTETCSKCGKQRSVMMDFDVTTL